MELLSMENLSEGEESIVLEHLRRYGDIERANEIIKFFCNPDLPLTWTEWIDKGYVNKLNSLLRG